MPQAFPGLDRNRWTGLWCRLGARENERPVFESLASSYTDPARAYHTAAHIQDCLTQLDWSRELAARPDEVEAAIWFHDVIYAPGASDNEDRSASLAQAALTSGGVRLDTARRIARLVLATRHRDIPSDPDAQHVCDIDLSILGRPDDEFDVFETRIRREYAIVPDPVYRRSRSILISDFLRRPRIYQTEKFAERYEAQARRNLTRALVTLSG